MSAVSFRKQFSDRNAEGFGNIGDDAQGRIALAAFDAADVRPVSVRSFRKFFLAPSASLAQLPHPLAEPVLGRLHGPESSLETAYGSRDYEYYFGLVVNCKN